MEWDTDYDTSLVSSRCWPDPAQLAGALMAVPSLSDSLAVAQSTSPARKRKLFGANGTLSPGRAASKHASSNATTAAGRQLANLPSFKRARMSHSHPLSRSSVSPPRQSHPPPQIYRHHSHNNPSAALRRSPSPVQIIRSHTPNATSTIHSSNGTLSPDERTCVSCRRTATSLLQLAKFHKCSLCGGLSCPICSRVCHTAEDHEDTRENDNDEDHDEVLSSSITDLERPCIRVQDDTNETVTSAPDQIHGCGKPVCRGCSVESPNGTVQCYRCHSGPPR